MPRASVNGIEIEYEVLGPSDADPLILISGLGAQMTFWKDEFCEMLIDRGFRVIRFDNRDTGMSTKLDHLGVPSVPAIRSGEEDAPYTMEDMAADTIGVLDEAGVDAAHVVGISLGGYVAQAMAINYPRRVLSLVSMMSAPGGRDNAYGDYPYREEDETPPADRNEKIERRLREIEWMSSPTYFDRETVRADVVRSMDRATSPAGAARQTGAVHASSSRVPQLRELQVPALVIHGELDPSLLVANAHETAEAIPGAKLVVFPDVAHDLPRQKWETIIDLIAENAARETMRAAE